MALHFWLRVNGNAIGLVYIQRLEEVGPDGLARYTATVRYREQERTIELVHAYVDGALVLVRKALQAIEEMDSPPRFTCPRCGKVSAHPKDLEEGYCGACHDWTG